MTCKDSAEWRPLYLSGELGAASASAFEEHVRSCGECALELDRETRLDAKLRSSVLAEEIDSSALNRRVRQRIAAGRISGSARWMALTAGIAALFLAGTFGYRKFAEVQSTKLCADAAQDHIREVVRGQPRRWLSDLKAIEQLAERNGLPGSSVAAFAPSGYRLERAKLCRLDGHIFLHLVYTENGREFSTYLRRETTPGKAPTVSDTAGEHVAYVRTSQVTAMVVTWLVRT